MARTLFDFSRLSDTELDSTAENILVKLSANGDFPDPYPNMETLQTNVLAYRQALVDAALGDRAKMRIRDEKRKELERTLHNLAFYVEKTANGNTALVLSAGFSVDKPKLTVGPLPKPDSIIVVPGLHGSGMATVKVKRNLQARLYWLEYRLLGTKEWTRVQQSRSRFKLTGLQPLSQYEFRAAYLGTDPTVTYSDVVVSYVG